MMDKAFLQITDVIADGDRDRCPNCDASLLGKPIPPEHQEAFGRATHFRREIGVEVQGVYDGVLFLKCPDCRGTWNRWPVGHALHALAEDWRLR